MRLFTVMRLPASFCVLYVCLCMQIVSLLKEEIGVMEKEHSDLQLHISRTDWWCENLGAWRAVINTAEVSLPGVALGTTEQEKQIIQK